jgi:multidrug resistance efflux pump
MEKLPPIPTPLGTQWREFRFKFLPGITFLGLLALITFMWRNYVIPPNVLAEVEPATVHVISTLPGTLISLSVERFQKVTNGQEIGQIRVMETNLLVASLAAMEADLGVKRSQLDINELRSLQTYEQERLLTVQQRVQLNLNKVLLTRYAADYVRTSNLFFSKPSLVSEAQYDQSLALYEKTKVDVEETEKLIAERERTVPRLLSNSTNLASNIERDIKAREETLRAGAQNLVLRAPIDGTVSLISNRAGERVMAGGAIVTITPSKSDRIIAYVRQPINFTPKVDDLVQVRQQTFKRRVGYGKVLQVGTQLEPIDRALLVNQGVNIRLEMGLPFLIKVPENLSLAPGERVDVVLNPHFKPVEN